MGHGFRVGCLAASVGLALIAGSANAQADAPATTVEVENPASPDAKARAAAAKKRIALERELAKLRATYFRSAKDIERRQTGLAKLRTYTDPDAFGPMLKVFAREGPDVQATIVDIYADAQSDAGDAALAWVATMATDPDFIALGQDRLRVRVNETGSVPQPVVTVLDMALRGESDERANRAAGLANEFDVVGLIPRLINAQFSGGGGGGRESDRTGDLAFIAIGRQVAFVSDLTPVVSDSAVGFDPTISTVNEGTLIRIHDAVVTTYRTEVHRSLVDLSSRAWGQSTSRLSYDRDAWRRWYTEDFLPSQEAARNATATAAEDGSPQAPASSGG